MIRAAALVLLALGACTTAPQPSYDLMMAHDSQCVAGGAARASPAYYQCRERLRAAEPEQVAVQPVIVAAPVRMPQLPPPVHHERRTTNCTSSVIGQQIYTNCY